MIVQCEACQTRFRLADEKIKPEGTKVRCSKCKVVFTVMPPEPEPAEETVDFNALNMEEVPEESTSPAEQDSRGGEDDSEAPPETEAESSFEPRKAPESDELDFSSLETQIGDGSNLGGELADEFSFADTSQPRTDDTTAEEPAPGFEFAAEEEPPGEEQTDFGAAFTESEDAEGPLEFDFNESSTDEETGTETATADFATDGLEQPSDFSFAEEDETADESGDSADFSFAEENDSTAFGFEETEAPQTAAEESSGPSEFSFDEDDDTSAWEEEEPSGDANSFDFGDPHFASENEASAKPRGKADEGGLQFGEIDFADSSDGSAGSAMQEDDFSKATMELKTEPESFRPSPQKQPSHVNNDEEPLPAPPPAKKSALSRVLILLVLLLVVLGGAAGFLFMQGGTLNLNIISQYLPFLQEYIGEAPVAAPGDRISINIIGSSYVNGKAGLLLVIQGEAVNNHPSTRSAITVKGILIDDKGQTLRQQTVFCGNQLNDAALSTMSFDEIEEEMNNQFGVGLSNMNVAAKAAIPFTIVFRKIPDNIANINVEVVDSKPGAG